MGTECVQTYEFGARLLGALKMVTACVFTLNELSAGIPPIESLRDKNRLSG